MKALTKYYISRLMMRRRTWDRRVVGWTRDTAVVRTAVVSGRLISYRRRRRRSGAGGGRIVLDNAGRRTVVDRRRHGGDARGWSGRSPRHRAAVVAARRLDNNPLNLTVLLLQPLHMMRMTRRWRTLVHVLAVDNNTTALINRSIWLMNVSY